MCVCVCVHPFISCPFWLFPLYFTILNNDALAFMLYFWIDHVLSVLLDIYLGSEITASYANLGLTFWGNAKRISTAVVSFYILTSSGQGLTLSTYSSVFVIFYLFKKFHGIWSSILFWFAFPQWQMMFIFYVFIGHMCILFWRNSYSNLSFI